jgi:phosphatidylglycerophosphatase A
MKKSALFTIALTAMLVVPALALAQNFTYVNNWLNQALYWLRLSITVLMIAMTLFFLWGVFNFIKEQDPGKAADKKKIMWNGLLGLFISVAVWGIIRIAGNIVGVDVNNNNTTPGVTCPPGMKYSTSTGTCIVG